MAATVVQAATPGYWASGNPAATFPAPPTPGNWVVVFAGGLASDVAVAGAGVESSWVSAVVATGTDPGGYPLVEAVWYGQVTESSDGTIDATPTGGAYFMVQAVEVTGVTVDDNGNPTVVTGTHVVDTATETTLACPTLTATAGDLYIGAVISAEGVNPPYTAAAGFTATPPCLAQAGTTVSYNQAGYQTIKSPGSTQLSFKSAQPGAAAYTAAAAVIAGEGAAAGPSRYLDATATLGAARWTAAVKPSAWSATVN